MNVDERALLNEALLRRAEIFESKSNSKLAILDLLRITPEFKSYEDARLKLRTLAASSIDDSKPISASKDLTEKRASNKVNSERSLKAVATQIAQKSLAAALPAQAKLASIEKEPSEGAASAFDSAAAANPLPTANHSAETSADRSSSTESGASTKSVRKYSDSEVAHYNKLLAEFFSSSHPASDRVEARKTGGAEALDPPSLKEWLDKGKPNF